MSYQDEVEKDVWNVVKILLKLGGFLFKVAFFVFGGILVYLIKKLLEKKGEGESLGEDMELEDWEEQIFEAYPKFLRPLYRSIFQLPTPVVAIFSAFVMFAIGMVVTSVGLSILYVIGSTRYPGPSVPLGEAIAMVNKWILFLFVPLGFFAGYSTAKEYKESKEYHRKEREQEEREGRGPLKIGQKTSIPQEMRLEHMYVVGKTGSGKTKALLNWLLQDIFHNRGCAFIDPHGDAFDECLRHIAKRFVNEKIPLEDLEKQELLRRLVILDPTDEEYAVGINPLQKFEGESDLNVGFRFESTVKKLWGFDLPEAPRMGEITRSTAAAIAANGLTLVEAVPFLASGSIRAKMAQKIKNEQLRRFLVEDLSAYAKQRDDPIGSAARRIRTFTTDERITAIIGQRKSTLRFKEAMDGKQVILCKIPTGSGAKGLGDLGRFLGALLVSQFHNTASSRTPVKKQWDPLTHPFGPPEGPDRQPFYLYIDEFQNFISGNFPSVLAEMRKFGLHFILAHQYTKQGDEEFREDVMNAIFGNVKTMVAFQVDADDAERLASEFYVPTGKMVRKENERLEIFNLGGGLRMPVGINEKEYLNIMEEVRKRAGLFRELKDRQFLVIYKGSKQPKLDTTEYLQDVASGDRQIKEYVAKIKEISNRRWARPRADVLQEIEERQKSLFGKPDYAKGFYSGKTKKTAEAHALRS